MRFDPTLWSLSNINNFKNFGRTKNGLKRYNRRIGDHFANAHPSLGSFISVIKNKFLYFAEKAREIRENSSGIQYRQEKFTVPKIKQEYLIWKNSNQQAHFILEVFGDLKV
ncbi:hypothetical protein MXB_1681 [Myxobolus squamalis]|nr:hypothetical protein MXB_1681 [Myxobolus squamalis]